MQQWAPLHSAQWDNLANQMSQSLNQKALELAPRPSPPGALMAPSWEADE
jgi:hypothetical protein